ncbi:GreA/GreB family elongation factor [Neptuniibacter marinus]|uniref:GreA/GreB family elongation factor n=1 Tax=Neptuniibacter marinus TaxID=1806670 RepID=UPI000947042B|nr:GreA/GreB family elongation factor [Neptuniibacter marinus]
MNKYKLLKQVVMALERDYQNAIAAAERAHQSATDKENVAENKYDTLGLEAAYLAEGQSRRVMACEEELRSFQQLLESSGNDEEVDEIGVGSLVKLEGEIGAVKYLLIGRLAGGLKVKYDDHNLGQEVMVITPSSPLGKALMGLGLGDQVDIGTATDKKSYQVAACY